MFAIALGFGLYASQQEETGRPRGGFEQISVQLKWKHQAQFAGLYVAQEKGFYRDEGLEVVDLKRGGPDAPPIPAVLSGEADFGIAGADDVLVAVSEGKPIKAIATIYQESPVVYFALKESGIERPQDFIGKRVGLRKGTGTYFTYVAMMNNLGLDRNQVIEVSAESQDITPLLEGDVDVWPGFRINEPKVAERMGYEVNLIKPENFGVDIYADVLITTQEMIENRPDLVRAFVSSTLKGWEWAVANQEEAVDIVMNYAEDTNREHQRDMLEASVPLIKRSQVTEIGEMNFSRWNRTYTLLRQYGVIPIDIDVKEAYTREFISQ